MRISDWSSDVCSSDLHPPPAAFGASAVTAAPDIGVLLVNLGTPDAPEPGAVRRYLAQFLSDRRVVEIPPLVWQPIRSEERRVGKEWVSTCRSRGTQYD